jgi:transposase
MRKIRKISELQPTIAFTEFDIFRDYGQSFHNSELGKIYQLFPFAALSKSLKLKESSLGRHSYFSPEGKIALMLLKSYTGLSDQDLIAQLNANIHYQIFCGVRINPLSPLSNFKIVSEIRCELGKKLNIDSSQQILAHFWKPYLEHTSVMMTDATCYESAIRFPTDVKILWESVDWIYRQQKVIVKSLKIRMPRSKYDKQSRRYHSYCKKRKRKESETRVLKRSLLHLLNKLIGVLETTIRSNGSRIELSALFHKRLAVIKKVLQQQSIRFQGGEVKGLIVSIDKDYIRPIVRGKESKRVEFGAKVNIIQVDGINFIEHLSFNAFNEGIRIPQCVNKHQHLLRKRVTHLAADRIYATNDNRTYCSNPNRKIITSFIRKGKPSKNEAQAQQMRNLLNRERSTRLEGSFGTEKQHYSLDKVKARTKHTEML